MDGHSEMTFDYGFQQHKVTAYVPCYNGEHYLADTLQGLLEQDYPPTEILVVDDGSTDRTPQIAHQFPVRLVQHKKNKGLAAARNTAIQHAKYEFVASVDADVIPRSDWLQQLMIAFTNDKIAGTGGRLIERFRESPANRWRTLHMTQDLGAERIVVDSLNAKGKYLSGFGTVYRKSALQHVGGYNELYRTNYEDADIGRRLIEIGYELVYEPKAIAYHMRCDTPYSVSRMAWYWDFWPQYYSGGYNSIWRKLFQNLCWELELVGKHLKMGAISLLLVDFIYFALYCYWDLRYCLSANQFPPGLVAPLEDKF